MESSKNFNFLRLLLECDLMRIRMIAFLMFCCIVSTPVSAHGKAESDNPSVKDYTGTIYLYGEQHGVKKIMEKEIELWCKHYEKGCRHLFLELPSYTAEFLTLYLKEKNDTLLEDLFQDWTGTAFHNQHTLSFFRDIKKRCPQTIFHGTDVGHQYDTTGERFLRYLESSTEQNKDAYRQTEETIRQGKIYYTNAQQNSMAYRENMMVKNFIAELTKVNNADVVGIYGSAHTDIVARDTTGTVPCMAQALKALYGDNLLSEDLTPLAKEIEAIKTDTIMLAGTSYRSYYYGKQDLQGFKGFSCREFWRLDGAYDAIKRHTKGLTGDFLPENNYPMKVETGHVYVIDYTKLDGTTVRLCYICEGKIRNGALITEQVIVE